MTPYKASGVDIRRNYSLFQQIGATTALGVLLVAFSIPLGGDSDVVEIVETQEIIEIEDIEQTRLIEPPPPPPPAPPPPQEVPDNAVIEEEIIDEIKLDLDARFAVPIAPPAPPAPPPPPPQKPIAEATPPPPPPPEPEPAEPDIFEVVEQRPELIGGLAGLQARVVYPPMAREAGVEGKVFVRFIVDERGDVSEVEAVRCSNALICDAAMDAIKASQFRPGLQRGRPVKVRFVIPVDFQLRAPTD